MPRYLLLISLPLFFSALAFCPADAKAELAKGLIAGWNHSTWNDQGFAGEDYFQPRNGFCLGAFVGADISGLLGWRGEILYTQKGAVTSDDGYDENGDPLGLLDTHYNVDYLEIPLLFTITIPTGGAVRPVIQTGPAVDFELSATKETRYASGIQNPFNDDGDFETDFSTDFGWVFAGGVDIDAGGKVINLQVRYVMGQKKVYFHSTNRTLSVMAGFGI